MDTDSIDKRTEAGPVAIYLTPEEAIVLDAFLNRGQRAGDRYGTIEDQAELRVLWDLGSILESWLTAPMASNYEERLQRARAIVRDAAE